jgi:cell division protein FtsQ
MSTRPKRRKKSTGARLRPFWILFILITIAAGAGGYYAATWPGFFPKPVTVAGNKVVPTAQILSRAQIAAQQNIWLQSMGKAAQRIEAIPYVKTARIHRSLPAGVRIVVTERTPFAVLQTSSGRAVVDGDLRVLEPEEAASTLPVIVTKLATVPPDGTFVKDAGALRLRDDYDALAAAHVPVRSLRFDKFGDLVAGTRGGISLLLGDDSDLTKKTPLIDPIISQVTASGKKLAAVDLRAPKTPVVVYKR